MGNLESLLAELLSQEEDHRLVVNVLREFLAG